MERVYIGLGSNLAEPRQQLHSALQAIGALPHSQLLGVSSFYLSDPLGPADQPRYVNAVAALDCAMAPLELLDALQAIELDQRIEDKGAGVQVIVRYLQARFVDQALAEQQNIQVQGAGSPALGLAYPALIKLDGLQGVEQLQWLQGAIQLSYRIQVARLVGWAERVAEVKG